MVEITSNDIEFIEYDNDAGVTYVAKCPNCKTNITVAERGWWDKECECGYSWSIEINIIGKK